jgi:ribosomal protein S12 methylthiotransferase accessory factor
MDTAERAALATVTHEGGVKFRAAVRDHAVLTDQPVSAGGEGSAVTPLELIAVALGSCVALYIVQFCQARALATAGLRVAVKQQTSRSPYRVSRYDVDVVLPDGFPERYRATVEHIARSCPAHNTLLHAPEICVTVRPESVPAPDV